MADQVTAKSTTSYVSESPASDDQRFKGTLQRVVGVPKAGVDAATKYQKIERKMEKGDAKNGR